MMAEAINLYLYSLYSRTVQPPSLGVPPHPIVSVAGSAKHRTSAKFLYRNLADRYRHFPRPYNSFVEASGGKSAAPGTKLSAK